MINPIYRTGRRCLMNQSMFRWSKDKTSKLYPFRKFMAGDIALVLQFLAAFVVILFDAYIPGALLFGVLFTVILLLSDDLVSVFPTFMAALCFVIQAQNTYNKFIVFLPFIIVPVMAGVFHAIVYMNPYKTKMGVLFVPMLMISFTNFLGGLGTITASEYFSTTSLTYMFSLGFMIVIMYWAFSGHIGPGKNYTDHMDERMAKLMCAVTAFLILAVLEQYTEHWTEFTAHPGILYMQWRNNGCTLLMIAMPFTFYMALKKFPYIILSFGSMIAMVLSGSRGGLIMGGIEFVILLILYVLMDKEHRKIIGLIVLSFFLLVAVLLPKLITFMSYTAGRFTSASQYNVRLGLWKRSIQDFKANPIFGRGLGYRGNRDIHPSKTATLCWYHSSLPQVWGSFGLLGLFTYGYQMKVRLQFLNSKKSLFGRTVFLSFIGLELMSLVNPGIFASVYLVIITTLFIVLEQYPFPNMLIHITYTDPDIPVEPDYEDDGSKEMGS